MNALEKLSLLPQFGRADAGTLLAMPAWAAACRIGETQCVMKLDAPVCADPVSLAIKLGDEDHVLELADSEYFANLHSVWGSRGEMPQAILLALIEKDCGAFFQMLENTMRRELKIKGLAEDGAAGGGRKLHANVYAQDRVILSFAIDASEAMIESLGVLRNIDASHPKVRGMQLPCEVQYAAFTLPQEDLADYAAGDALLVPEATGMKPLAVVAGALSVSGEGQVLAWKDEGLVRVVGAEEAMISLGDILDEKPFEVAGIAPLTPLKLVRGGIAIASGRYEIVGEQGAMVKG